MKRGKLYMHPYKWYSWMISLALLFHVLNNLSVGGDIKVFHIFCVMAFGFGVMLMKKFDDLQKLIAIFLLWTVLSSCLSPISVAIQACIKFVIVVSSAYFITFVPIRYLVRAVNIVIPIAILILVVNYFTGGNFYRYQGFYEDPNYLCTTLLCFYFFIQLAWKWTVKRWIKFFLTGEIVLVLFLVTLSISRTGIACFFLMTLGFWGNIFLKHKVKSLLGLLVIVGLIMCLMPDLVDMAIEGYAGRAGAGDAVNSAAHLRLGISMNGIKYVFSHPCFLLQGIGFGCYTSGTELEGWKAYYDYMDHNTLTSCLTEQGVVGFLLLMSILLLLFVRLVRNKSLKMQGLRVPCVISMITFVLFSMSIFQSLYLPWWIVIFTLIRIGSTAEKLSYRHFPY